MEQPQITIEDSKGKTKNFRQVLKDKYRPTTLKITFNKQRTRRVISEEKRKL